MSLKRLLLLSNSTNYGQGFLEHGKGPIKTFLGPAVPRVLFVPYAGVTFSWDAYAEKVRERFRQMGYELESVHESDSPVQAVQEAEAIAVGGGNTFHLAFHLYQAGLLEPIRERVLAGIPYIGWSAGSNVACPSIKTTNDMPIIEPPRFEALNLVPFQINPHYLDTHPAGHQGETRDDRIAEFVEINPDMFVVGLREGSILQVEDEHLTLLGGKKAKIFRKGQAPFEVSAEDSLQFLMM